MIDLSTVSDEDLKREYMRWHNAHLDRSNVGRKKVLRECPKGCGCEFGTAEMRTHIPRCTGKPAKKRSRKATR